MRWVYFIKPVGMDGPVKIGCSQSPDGRRETLSGWSPFPLEVVASIAGDVDLERRFHAKFYASHTHREWFRPTPELLIDIAAIADGVFDISTLPEPKRLPTRRNPNPMRWTDDRRAAASRRKAMHRTIKETGLVCDYPHTPDRVDAFIADPAAHGVTPEQRDKGIAKRIAEYHLERYQSAVVAMAEDRAA